MTVTASSSPSKSSTSPHRAVKKKAKVSANDTHALATHDGHAASSTGTPATGPLDPGQLLLERRLFSSRTSKRLDLSIASTHHRSNQSHSSELTTFQVFPRQIFVHEHLSGHHLRELWLTNHHISILPAEIGHFPNLRVLGLGGNALTTLPTEIGQLPSLECLYLERNQLRNLPDDVVFPSKLSELRLDRNALSVFPLQLTRLRLLNRLGLSHNQLSSLPQEIRRMINLVELDLDVNRLQLDGIPNDAVVRLQKLERLGLDGNLLSERPHCLKLMPNVMYVRLNGNRRWPTEAASSSGDSHNQVTTVPRRQDGYFQTVKGYQAENTHSAKSQEAKRGGDTLKPQPEPLEGLVACRDQNTVNAHTYRLAVPHL